MRLIALIVVAMLVASVQCLSACTLAACTQASPAAPPCHQHSPAQPQQSGQHNACDHQKAVDGPSLLAQTILSFAGAPAVPVPALPASLVTPVFLDLAQASPPGPPAAISVLRI